MAEWLILIIVLVIAFVLFRCLKPPRPSIEEFLRHFPELKSNRKYIKRLFNREKTEMPGFVYVFKVNTGRAINPLQRTLYKVGMTARTVKERVKQLSERNEERYLILRPVSYTHLTLPTICSV
eukprot:TRINITY_DN13580_c0_g1_i4.p1 TRINITY_DN13580_c0_g1~~TRINITY_DN13580_c0_g1_i4.p1  ORF type:complete len:123 (-),score=18.86 TRINITY_DN13580_c0_g1_i4:39-407(-)